MAARRRSRRRPLTNFATRSPLHGLVVWLGRSALILLAGWIAYLLVVNVIVPGYVEQMVEQVRPS